MIRLFFEASHWQKLIVILLFGLLLRVAWALTVPVVPVSDSVVYAKSAANIALHGVYGVEPDKPFSYWPVGAPAIYAAAYKVLGINTTTIVLFNILASLALIFTASLICRRWFDDNTALITAVILACWPSLIMYVTIFASEIFFSVFVNLALLAWCMSSPRWAARAIIAGIMIGAATYVRPVSLLLPFVIMGIEIVQRQHAGRVVAAVIIVCVVTVLFITPWTVRNTKLHGGFMLISSNGGPNLWMGNNPDASGSYMPLPEYSWTMNELQRAKVLKAEAKRYILENPGRTAAMFVHKLTHTHLRETIAVHWNELGIRKIFGAKMLSPLKVITQAYWSIVLLLALAMVVIVVQRAVRQRSFFSGLRTLVNPPFVYWLYFALLHAVIVSQDRYHFPSIPFIAILSAMALNHAWIRLSSGMPRFKA